MAKSLVLHLVQDHALEAVVCARDRDRDDLAERATNGVIRRLRAPDLIQDHDPGHTDDHDRDQTVVVAAEAIAAIDDPTLEVAHARPTTEDKTPAHVGSLVFSVLTLKLKSVTLKGLLKNMDD